LKIQIIIENAYWARIPIISNELARQLDDFLSVKCLNAIWSQAYKNRIWDGKKHFFSLKTNRFLQCLSPFVADFLSENGCEVSIKSNCELIMPQFHESEIPKDIQLRDYQKDCILSCLNNGNGLIKSPTSSGKTVIFSTLIKLYNTKTLVLVHRKNLAEQLYARLSEWGIDCDLIHSESDVEYQNHQVCILLVQSSDKITNYSDYKLVIVDEIHTAVAKSYESVIKKCTNAYNKFGFSATFHSPKSVEYLTLIGQYGKLLYELKVSELLDRDEKVLAEPTIVMVRNRSEKSIIDKQNEDKLDSANAWTAVENRVYVYNVYRNMLIVSLVKKHTNDKVFILVRRKDHGEFLSKILHTPYLCGETPLSERKEMIADFESGKSKILLGNEQVLGVGIDIRGGFAVMINASGSKTDIPVIQKIGRALRMNKEGAVTVYDFYDDDSNTISHSQERVEIYKETFGKNRVSVVDIDSNGQLYDVVKNIINN
jgi:superfamily II DNA or RNA helicase